MTATTGDRSIRVRVGTILIYLSCLVLLGSAAAKFVQVPTVASKLAVLGFSGSKLLLIAGLELAGAILFAYPRTRAFGLLFLSAYLGGAVAAHVAHDQLPFQPAFVLALIWIGISLRHPEVLGRLRQTPRRSAFG
jgi:DoxX-like family